MLTVSLDADLRSVLRRLRNAEKGFIPSRDGVGFTTATPRMGSKADKRESPSTMHPAEIFNSSSPR